VAAISRRHSSLAAAPGEPVFFMVNAASFHVVWQIRSSLAPVALAVNTL
jgi:hypothetical protein